MRYQSQAGSGKLDDRSSVTIVDIDGLIVSHLAIVKRMAYRLRQTLRACVSMDDLIGAGMLGLTRAAYRWQPNRGVAFSYYARLRIRGQMLDELRAQDLVKRRTQRANKGEPLPELVPLASEPIAPPCDPTRRLTRDEFPSGLLRMLNRQERMLLDLHYIRNESLGAIAGHFGVSSTRVSQIHRRLKSKARTWYLAAGVA